VFRYELSACIRILLGPKNHILTSPGSKRVRPLIVKGVPRGGLRPPVTFRYSGDCCIALMLFRLPGAATIRCHLHISSLHTTSSTMPLLPLRLWYAAAIPVGHWCHSQRQQSREFMNPGIPRYFLRSMMVLSFVWFGRRRKVGPHRLKINSISNLVDLAITVRDRRTYLSAGSAASP